MTKLALILTGSIALASPAVAQAHAHHHHVVRHRENPTSAARQIAVRYWGATPCAGQVTVYMGTPPANDENGGADASMWSSWQGANGGEENSETAVQPFTHCQIGINSSVWTSEEQAAFVAWPEFSIQLVHEFGHLLGHAHSTDPASVMYHEPPENESITGETAPGWR